MKPILDLDKFDYESLLPLKLKSIFYSIIIDKLLFLEDYYKELELDYMFLFGSCSRGEAFNTSDVDILLLTHSNDERHVMRKCDRLGLNDHDTNPEVQFTVRRTDRFIDLNLDYTNFHEIISKDLKLLRRYLR